MIHAEAFVLYNYILHCSCIHEYRHASNHRAQLAAEGGAKNTLLIGAIVMYYVGSPAI